MEQPHVDSPDDITWLRDFKPAQPIGPCPHLCDHMNLTVIAWGPDYDRYELIRCDDTAYWLGPKRIDGPWHGCRGRCRAWQDSRRRFPSMMMYVQDP